MADLDGAGGHGDTHGNSPAAWTGVSIILAGFVLGSVALILSDWWLFWIAAVVAAVGPLVGAIMSANGLGNRARARSGEQADLLRAAESPGPDAGSSPATENAEVAERDPSR